MGGLELADLVARVARQDRAAFAALYDATSGRVYGLILRVLRDPGYAEETLQEVYLQVWQNAVNYRRESGSVISWMMTIGHRRAVDRVRAEEAASRRGTEYTVGNAMTVSDEVVDSVVTREDRREVIECLGTLTDTQRESIEMSYYQGLTYREVAERLEAALPTVKSRIRDGLRRLRNCLESAHEL
ncbi:ECF RNA polymerase sigma factor SigK [Williamsia sterculiae]|uniref:RNA polymerase sigma-70 factor, ECF subfamily n=1 Tax=Williamsia sterculiae TaxID=1344003 RepID=A0A1N7HCU2_9NOCA|nr:ECF RNA polymerase sigma factor SigK [Williamsia sterculiae]SIS22498.1 RNA polymerase sigma-70 factor, ECF subfamily [Williamsia sterculiae]